MIRIQNEYSYLHKDVEKYYCNIQKKILTEKDPQSISIFGVIYNVESL